ncbi:MAG: hypothetical protein R3A44_01925 [Caldilineaceae bacterium]
MKAYPFHIEILTPTAHCAPRTLLHAWEQVNPGLTHYLPLLAERLALSIATPMRQCGVVSGRRSDEDLCPAAGQSGGALSGPARESRRVRSFIQILMLHAEQPPEVVEQAITQALAVAWPIWKASPSASIACSTCAYAADFAPRQPPAAHGLGRPNRWWSHAITNS